jgi:hypothetical protein
VVPVFSYLITKLAINHPSARYVFGHFCGFGNRQYSVAEQIPSTST